MVYLEYGMAGPGFDRAMDAIKYANAAGSAKHGGVLAIAGDDHGAKSSTLPHQSDHNFISAFCSYIRQDRRYCCNGFAGISNE